MEKLLAGFTILIVDDEDDIRDYFNKKFTRLGASVKSASNGREAFKLVKNERIDLILTDVKMPIASGLDLLAWVNAMGKDSPPVYLITAHEDLSESNALTLGAAGFFKKPIDIAKVVEYLTNNLIRVK